MFEREGHKHTFVKTVVSYVHSLHDVLILWKLEVLSSTQLAPPVPYTQEPFPLLGRKVAVLAQIKDAITSCFEHYSSMDAVMLGKEHQVPVSDEDNSATEQPPHAQSSTMDWTSVFVVKGKLGMGKTQVLLAAIQYCLVDGLSVLVATPKGFLVC